ncbi:tudor domain-containing protein 15 [Scyliorhinus torazame]|uniref:tudor domain-containing protein 15 n=1 Tax=Scyliorhinus torazame TaxID=75743 RepID=UPI003B5B8144
MYSTFTSPVHTNHLDLNITHVECCPEKLLVRFWGRSNNVCELDYHILHNEVQNSAKTSANIAIGEFCFAEDLYNAGWYRGKVIRKDEESYDVFLVDVGMVLTVEPSHIASAKESLFQLPPKVVCGIFANIVPVKGTWSPTAVKYFLSLVTFQIKGYIEDILMDQIMLVEVPNINQKLFDLGLANILDGNTFHFILEISEDLLGSGYENTKTRYINKSCRKPVLDKTITLSPSFQRILDVLSPSLQTGVTEAVKITCASGLHNFYCQLKRLTSELEAMTGDLKCYYENEGKELNDEPIDNFGALCAAKGKDGKWYRGVVKQLLTSGQIEVWFMDYGRTEIVFPDHIKKLMPNFFTMPLMSFPCALTGLSNQTKQWIRLQTEIFKESLFEETLIICIDSYSCEEHLYYVTFYKQKNIHIHQMTGMLAEANPVIECCPKKENKDIDGQFGKFSETKMTAPRKVTCKSMHRRLGSVGMKINASYVGFVEYVINPSDFWIRTSEHNDEFECLMMSITNHYSKIGINEELLQEPVPGLFCCARYSKDLHYYRAVITEVLFNQLRVFFVDFGNAEVVDFNAVKSLLPEYTNLPAMAMNCSVAYVFPIEEVWTKDATNYFKNAVFHKQLFIEVISRQGSKYTIDMKDMECREQSSIGTLMLQAGYADFWNVQSDDALLHQRCMLKSSRARTTKFIANENRKCTDKNATLENSYDIPVSNILVSTVLFPAGTTSNNFSSVHLTMPTWIRESKIASPYRQQVFKLGSVLDVRVSHVNSPAEFWCQLQRNSNQLQLLMRNMQHYYSTPKDAFQLGHIGCVARCSKDGQWYRASVIQRNFPKEEVTVLFVDYGMQQKIAMKNLRAINPEFLRLEGQAFRCTFNSIIRSVNHDPSVWDKISCCTFKRFIDNLISGGRLKCTIFAMALMDGKGLCNVVDLHTPLINVCQLLLDMGLAACVETPCSFSPAVQLYTPYYSAHGLKVGSEEKVYVTHVSSLSKFYCQLDKNTVILDTLRTEVDIVSKKMQEQRLDLDKTSICLARYFEDGQWYRALARSVHSPEHFKVFFIDYGNTEIVDKNDVVPIPEDAKDLILIPMQAVKCCLPLSLPKLSDESIALFKQTVIKQTVIGNPITAFVIAKKSDGQLVLELYDGSVKISAQITEQYMHHHYRRDVICLDETKWQNGKSFHPTKNVPSTDVLINKKPDYIAHLIKETNRLIHSYMGHKNKDQNYNLKKKNTPCKTGNYYKNKYSKHRQNEIIPKFTAQLAKLKTTYSRKNSGEIGQAGKVTLPPRKTKMTSYHVINSKEMLPSTILCHLVQNSPATQKAMDRFEMICRTRKHCQGKWLLQNLMDLPQAKLITRFEKYIESGNSSSDSFIERVHNEHRTPDQGKEMGGAAFTKSKGKDFQSTHVSDDSDVSIKNDALHSSVKKIKLNPLFTKFIDPMPDLTYSKTGLFKKFLKPKLQGMQSDGLRCSEVSHFTNKLTREYIVCEFVQQFSQFWKIHLGHCTRSSAGKFLSEMASSKSSSQEALTLNKASEIEILISELDLSLQGMRNAPEKMSVEDKHYCTAIMSYEHQCIVNKEFVFQIDNHLLEKLVCSRRIVWLVKANTLLSVSNSGSFSIKLNASTEELFPLTLAVGEDVKIENISSSNAIERRKCQSQQFSEQDKSIIKLLHWEDKWVEFGRTDISLLQWIKVLNDSILNFIEQVMMWPWNAIENKQLLKYLLPPVFALNDQTFIELLRKLDSGFWEIAICQDATSLAEKYPAMVHKNISIITSQNCSSDLNGWMNKITSAETEINIASKTLLSVDNSMMCLSLNPILCGPIQTRVEYTGFATSVIDPSEFYIQLEDTFEIMETISSLLAQLSDEFHPLSQDILNPGVGCLIKLATDEQWSRVEIYEVCQQFVLVRAVDYGHYIFVPSSDLNRLRELPKELAEVPRLTNHCSLNNVVPSVGHNWTDEAIVFFQKSLNEQSLTVFFRQRISELLWEVDLFVNNKSVAEDLHAVGHAAFRKEIGNSFMEDSISSEESSQILTEPILEQQIYKSNDELTMALQNEEPAFVNFDSSYSIKCVDIPL